MAATAETGAPGRRAPLYSAVYEALRDALHAGSCEVGASLPSEAELSDRFAVSRITIRHALRLLEGDGYIRKARARRPVVIATTPAQNRLGGRIHGRHRRDGRRRAPAGAELAEGSSARSDARTPRPTAGDATILPAQNPRAQRQALCALDHLFPAADRRAPVARRFRRRGGLPGAPARTRHSHRRCPADRMGGTRYRRGCGETFGCEAGAALLRPNSYTGTRPAALIELAYSRSLAIRSPPVDALSTSARRYP